MRKVKDNYIKIGIMTTTAIFMFKFGHKYRANDHEYFQQFNSLFGGHVCQTIV